MNTLPLDTADNDGYNKTETPGSGNKQLILVLSENMHVIGFLQGYCHAIGCNIKTVPLRHLDHFFEILLRESPYLLFIDMTHLSQFFRRQEWIDVGLFIQRNKIALCGFGKQPLNGDEALSPLVFNKICTEPLNLEEIRDYLNDITKSNIAANQERRQGERRIRDRRYMPVFGERDAKVVSNVNNLKKGHTSDHRPDERLTKQIGPLIINYLSRSITVNGVPILVSQKEFSLILLLAERPGCVISVDDIVKTIWSDDKKATKADVHQYIYFLRKKLEENPKKPKLIITVKGFGYKLCP